MIQIRIPLFYPLPQQMQRDRYKEGHVILELALITESEGFNEARATNQFNDHN